MNRTRGIVHPDNKVSGVFQFLSAAFLAAAFFSNLE